MCGEGLQFETGHLKVSGEKSSRQSEQEVKRPKGRPVLGACEEQMAKSEGESCRVGGQGRWECMCHVERWRHGKKEVVFKFLLDSISDTC